MMPSTTRLPARNAALTTFAAALTCACVIASLATSLALRKAQDDGLVDPALAKLGMTDDRALSPTDLLPGADLRWEFPRLIAAQLEIGESFTFVLPGNRLVDIPLVDRSLIGPNAVGFIFADLDNNATAEITVHAGRVSGVVRAAFRQRSKSIFESRKLNLFPFHDGLFVHKGATCGRN